MQASFDFVVLTPAGTPDAALAIAAARSGALGVLNLEFFRDADLAIAEIERLITHASGRRLGVLVQAAPGEALDSVLAHPAAAALEAVLLTVPPAAAPPAGLLTAAVRTARGKRRRVYVVVTCLADALAAQAAGADAVIAKGYEAGGWVGDETTFVLLQRLARDEQLHCPVWAYGGVGLHSVAACWVGGAVGAVLDSQLLLTRESPLPEAVKAQVATLDGSETVCLGSGLGASFRLYARATLPIVDELRRILTTLTLTDTTPTEHRREQWLRTVDQRVDWRTPDRTAFALGQDVAFAAGLADRFGSVGGVLNGLRQALGDHVALARQRPLFEADSSLARSHSTRYPIVQGPMTRVSDQAEFAAAVARAGALPFLALALMRGPDVRVLLEETRRQLGDLPWGVGILGFVPPELRAEQLAVLRDCRPPFALIAGGRPDQARALEEDGTPAYLHVPSPGLLTMFLQDGARRFVFEGRECGGHVGPRTSFVLWESMLQVLLEQVPAGASAAEYHVIFAGGIHDDLSAAMVGVMAAPLAERGCRVGVLLGTAYLFTEEAVATGAITAGFQQAALACERTALLESGPGQATRCAPSPFVEEFEREKARLQRLSLSPEELRNQLELLNIGRLRIASKGVDRNPILAEGPHAPKLVSLDPAEQHARGMYMIGQVAVLRDRTCTLGELHALVSEGSTRRLSATVQPASTTSVPVAPEPAAVAIIGVGCIVPGAPNARVFWDNILHKVDAITEVPPTRWDWRQYYDPDRSARDKVYSRWGGFVDPVPFDPLEYGMPPNSLRSIEPFQLLGLAAVRSALHDSGYLDRTFPRERTSVMLGAGGGGGDLGAGYMVRSSLAGLFGESAGNLTDRLKGVLPEWTEDSFAGLLMNVAAGRAANRFDFGGLNFTVDAACASSLAAVYLAVRDLESGTSDVAIAGGVDAIENPFAFLCFSKTQALSPSGRCRPFDEEADGIAISEGFGVVVMKRLADAERDGDRIYAVIRGVGGSSDGRDRSLTAPRPEGQIRALERAYAQARFSPATVGLIEAHGTGTVVGDKTEVESLTTFFAGTGAQRQATAIGSVKSMIGHTKASAGVVGLIKVAMALHHKVLPATLGVKQPNARANFPETPFYVNTETRPWVHAGSHPPRRAGVEAFGFGGTNFHIALEEYANEFLPRAGTTADQWPVELFVWRSRSRADLGRVVASLLAKLEVGARPRLSDLAYSLSLAAQQATARGEDSVGLACVAGSLDELRGKLIRARDALSEEADRLHEPGGVHFAQSGMARAGGTAFLFPGQGSQYVNMARELAVLFPNVRACFDRADDALGDIREQPLSRLIFPPPTFTSEDARLQNEALTRTDVAQPALGATDVAYLRLLRWLGLEPDHAAGHSYGEFVALHAVGCIDEATLIRLSEARGRFIREAVAQGDSGSMAAIDAGPDTLRPLLLGGDVVLANLNAPNQTVISGPQHSVELAVATCQAAGLTARLLPVACAFHSPLVAPAQERLAELLRTTPTNAPRAPVYSNTTGARYSDNPAQVIATLSGHLVSPVEFVREVNAMYSAGARVFVEVGPRATLTGLVERILGGGHPHVCVALDGGPSRSGLPALLEGLATLSAEGASLYCDRLFEGRSVRRLDIARLELETGEPSYTPTTWLVDGGRARPATESRQLPGPLRIEIIDDHVDTPPAEVRTDGDIAPEGLALSVQRGPNSFSNTRTSEDKRVAMIQSPSESHPTIGTYIPPDAGVEVDGPTQVVGQFQGVMQRFLETQGAVMLAYLSAQRGGPPGGARSVADGHAPMPWLTAPPGAPNGRVPQLARPAPMARPASISVPAVADAVLASPAPSAPPPSPLEPAPTGSAAGATAFDRQRVQEQLLVVVSERTGYPLEMLGLTVDMEADLGIDSIKRVEIAGTLLRTLSLDLGATPDLERLTASRTLSEVIDNLELLFESSGSVAAATTGAAATRPFDGVPTDPGVGRYVLRPAAAPPIVQVAGLAAGAVVIVDDEAGVGEQLATRLSERGCHAVRVLTGGEPLNLPDNAVVARDLHEPEAVERLVRQLRGEWGSVCALVSLAGLRRDDTPSTSGSDAWAAGLVQLFLLVQALQPDLRLAAGRGGGAVLAATRLGGTFAVGASDQAFAPGQGGVAGFLKTLAQEMPTLRVKAVDTAPSEPSVLAGRLLDELLADDGIVEVGYADERTILSLVPEALAPRDVTPLLDESCVVLVTGGARGITAEAALVLARAYQPNLLLVGRTHLPVASEPAATARLTEPAALRRALTEQMGGPGRTTPAAVEQRCRELQRVREVRQNLARLEATGARVRYFACDVRESSSFGELIDEVYRTYGRIDGVIHGAGVIEDKLIQDKRLDSFDRVVATKLGSACVLASRLQPASLRFLVFFGSVSGRFGNRGQADYAAASEGLNKLAQQLDRRWSARVLTVNWGPWRTSGMVSPEVQRQFAERGVTLIPPEVGCRLLEEELRLGAKGQAEVLIGGARSMTMADPGHVLSRASGVVPERAPASLPLLAGRSAITRQSDGSLEVFRTLDPRQDRYLLDHCIDGRPVLPFAMALELMAEAAAACWPDLEVVEVLQVRVLQGIVVDGHEQMIRVAVQTSPAHAGARRGRSNVEVRVTIALAGQDRINYQARVRLGARFDAADGLEPPPLGESKPLPLSVSDVYREWLFHGPLFQGIGAIDTIGPSGARATLRLSAPGALLSGQPVGQWLIDPVVIDSALQMNVVWGRQHWDMTLLPSHLERYRRFAPLYSASDGHGSVRHELRIRPDTRAPVVRADHYLCAADGRMLGILVGMEGIGSRALNRLAGAARQARV